MLGERDPMRDTMEKYMQEALHLKDLGLDMPHLPRSDPTAKKRRFDPR